MAATRYQKNCAVPSGAGGGNPHAIPSPICAEKRWWVQEPRVPLKSYVPCTPDSESPCGSMSPGVIQQSAALSSMVLLYHDAPFHACIVWLFIVVWSHASDWISEWIFTSVCFFPGDLPDKMNSSCNYNDRFMHFQHFVLTPFLLISWSHVYSMFCRTFMLIFPSE